MGFTVRKAFKSVTDKGGLKFQQACYSYQPCKAIRSERFMKHQGSMFRLQDLAVSYPRIVSPYRIPVSYPSKMFISFKKTLYAVNLGGGRQKQAF